MARTQLEPTGPWLDLSEAARHIGVHFTTLRRWADAGKIPCIRTPGGRRRFALVDLQNFIDRLRVPVPGQAIVPLESRTLDVARRQLHMHPQDGAAWRARFAEEQRLLFRHSGQRLLGLLIQFGSRSDPGESFLEEGRRLAAEYGAACRQAGLSITETVHAFLFFGHSMLDAVTQAGSIHGPNDFEGVRLYRRMSEFLDRMLLATVESYSHQPDSTPALEG